MTLWVGTFHPNSAKFRVHRPCRTRNNDVNNIRSNFKPDQKHDQLYEIFENTFFTVYFRATAFDEEAWWSKNLILSSFLKKMFVEIIGVFNSKSC